MKNIIIFLIFCTPLYSCVESSNKTDTKKINSVIDSLTYQDILKITKSNENEFEKILDDFCFKVINQSGLFKEEDIILLFGEENNLYQKLFVLKDDKYKDHLIFITDRTFSNENMNSIKTALGNSLLTIFEIANQVKLFPDYQERLDSHDFKFKMEEKNKK